MDKKLPVIVQNDGPRARTISCDTWYIEEIRDNTLRLVALRKKRLARLRMKKHPFPGFLP